MVFEVTEPSCKSLKGSLFSVRTAYRDFRSALHRLTVVARVKTSSFFDCTFFSIHKTHLSLWFVKLTQDKVEAAYDQEAGQQARKT